MAGIEPEEFEILLTYAEVEQEFDVLRRQRDRWRAAYEMTQRVLEGQCRLMLAQAERIARLEQGDPCRSNSSP